MEPGQVFPARVSAVNAIVPVAPEKMHSFDGMEEEDRRAIQTVAKKVQTIQRQTVFSTKALPSRVILRFVGLVSVSVEELRMIRISNHRIREIKINLNQGHLLIELRRKVKRPVIKKRRERLGLDKKTLRSTVGLFLKTHASVVRESDRRVIEAVLECILRWTWSGAAAEVICERIGDNYSFKVKRLQCIRLCQLETLCDLGDYVREMAVQVDTKVLSFLVLRTSAYIENDQAKRRKG